MMRIRSAPVQFRTGQRRRLLRYGQATAAIAYIVLLGTVLPFICWGAWAEPGHAHAGPHFVFADPPQVHDHTPHEHGVHSGHGAEHTGPGTADVAGQAQPDSTLVIASMLVLVASALLLMQPRVSRIDFLVAQAESDHPPRIPTPPPRFSVRTAGVV